MKMIGAKNPEYGSDLIVDLMKRYDIKYAALNPGSSFRALHDSIVNYGGNENPKIVLACHEEIAVAIAHGYARASGQPGLAICHDVVGLQHASMAIYNAWIDRAPVIVLGATGPSDPTGDEPYPRLAPLHTAHLQGQLVRDYVKWDYQPSSLPGVVESFARAHKIALTEPMGPVYLCYDAKLQEDRVQEMPNLELGRNHLPSIAPSGDPEKLEEVVRRLLGAKNPVIIAGMVGRKAGTWKSLVLFAETLGIRVIDQGVRFNMPTTHPLTVAGAEKEILAEADVVLALDVIDLYWAIHRLGEKHERLLDPNARLIQIGMEDFTVKSWSEARRLVATDFSLVADTAVALPEMTKMAARHLTADEFANTREPSLQICVGGSKEGIAPLQDNDIECGDFPELGEVIAGKRRGRQSASETTLFLNNIGLGTQFAAVGMTIHEAAKAKGLGKEIPSEWFLETVQPE
jgi:acetolactate synthase-1/2/3 large subunit